MTDDAISRELAQLRADLRDDFTELKSQIASLLPRELANERHESMKQRMKNLEDEFAKQESERTASRRWAIGAIVFPLISVTVTIVLTLVR